MRCREEKAVMDKRVSVRRQNEFNFITPRTYCWVVEGERLILNGLGAIILAIGTQKTK